MERESENVRGDKEQRELRERGRMKEIERENVETDLNVFVKSYFNSFRFRYFILYIFIIFIIFILIVYFVPFHSFLGKKN